MSLYLNESKFLASDWDTLYFVRKEKRVVDWQSVEKLFLVECELKDDDQLWEDFRDNYDYKSERQDAVRYNNYEWSLSEFTDEVDENWWDYIEQVCYRCSDDYIFDRVQDNIDCNYSWYNIEILNTHLIEKREDWTWENYALRNYDNFEEDCRDDSIYMDIMVEMWEVDYQYMEI